MGEEFISDPNFNVMLLKSNAYLMVFIIKIKALYKYVK